MPNFETSPTKLSRGEAGNVPAAQRLLLDILDTVREPLLVLDHEFTVTLPVTQAATGYMA